MPERSNEDIIESAFGRVLKGQSRRTALINLSGRCNFSFLYFSKHVLGHDTPEFHHDIIEYLNQRFLLIILPRGHLKTTTYSQDYNVWRLWRETGIKICVTSSAIDQSQIIIEDIQANIESNEFLNPLMPKNRRDTWNKSQLNTTNGNKCFMKPYNSTARGTHVDYLNLDDILREENISQEQIKDVFWTIFWPTVQTRKGQILMVGTPMTATDLFAELQNPPEEKIKNLKWKWHIIKKSAVILNDKGEWIRPLWPTQFPVEELQMMKIRMGVLRWSREYMCNPLASGASLFKNFKIGSKEINKPREGRTYYLGCDVAMSAKRKADFLVYCIIEKDGNDMLWQVRQERYKGWDDRKIIKRTKELHKKFNFKKIIPENRGLSISVVKALTDIRRNSDTALVTEGFITNRKGKLDLIGNLQSAFASGILTVLDNPIIIKELNSFKVKEDLRTGKETYEGVGAHDDTVIALALATYGAMETTGKAGFDWV